MDLKEIKTMLKKHGLKLTPPRLKVLEVLISADRAVTYSEILEANGKTVDRVTVYRTLKILEDIGLIHRIMGAGDVPVYAPSTGKDNARQTGFKAHLHFYCTKCQGVFCLDDHAMPSVILPEAYQVHAINLILTGQCRVCNFPVNNPGLSAL